MQHEQKKRRRGKKGNGLRMLMSEPDVPGSKSSSFTKAKGEKKETVMIVKKEKRLRENRGLS